MIDYKKYRLDNGLRVIVCEDSSTPMVSTNILYGVGSRDEEETRTGFAHLFEHLMFGGTKRVPDFDAVLTEVGGESNAYTSTDSTNYYITLPARYLETAMWVESDRMRLLDFSERNLRVQQSVVTEEYNYRYINRPYGDMWLLLRPLCYKVHPYRWPTIGMDIRHVQEATLEDVERFFYRYYRPENAILAVVGNVKANEVAKMAEKWFGDIGNGERRTENGERRGVSGERQAEPEQTEGRLQEVERDVPSDALYMAFVMSDKLSDDFRTTDMISDLLSNGNSSRLYERLVKKKGLFSEIDAFITNEVDKGLLVVSGKMTNGVSCETGREAIWEELERIAREPVDSREIEKVCNKYENTYFINNYKSADCAASLCMNEWLGHIEWINDEPMLYRRSTADDVARVAGKLFRRENENTLYYRGIKGLKGNN